MSVSVSFEYILSKSIEILTEDLFLCSPLEIAYFLFVVAFENFCTCLYCKQFNLVLKLIDKTCEHSHS